jgi:predicted PurR-regulated permease PerM
MARQKATVPYAKTMTLISGLLVVAALYLAKDVLIPVALAILLSFLLGPLVHRLERWRIGRAPAVLGVVVLAFALLGGLGWLVASQAQQLGQNVSEYQGQIEKKFRSVQHWFGGTMGKATQAVAKISKEINKTTQPAQTTEATPLPVQVVEPPPTATRMVISVVEQTIGPLLQPLATAFMVIVLVIFMLMGRESLRDRFIRLVGQGQLTTTTQALDEAASRVSRYLLMQSLINGTYGLLLCLGLSIIGIPVPFLWGLLAALLRFIPYVGPWLGASMPVLLSLVMPSPWAPLWTGGLFIALEILCNTIMEPLLYGASTGVSPIAILVAAIFWAWLWGAVGLILATPLTVCLVVMGKYVPQLSFLNVLLGDEPVLKPQVRYYQRLLAEDQEEAQSLLEEYLKKRTREQVYDEMVIGALAMMQRDFNRGLLDEAERQAILKIVREQIAPAKEDAADASDEAGAVDFLCLPARDEADELVCIMLAELLVLAHFSARAISSQGLVSEIVAKAQAAQARVVCVSALPPGGIVHSRYLCKRLHRALGDLPMIVGLWRTRGDRNRARERIACGSKVQVVSSLAQAMEQIRQLVPQSGAGKPVEPQIGLGDAAVATD